ncbi:MAG: nascent polypeptide-associated complex protein [Candidatus Nanoarchaeia archaeon]|jgi:nascent polypeptide-associated complex subunit alpha
MKLDPNMMKNLMKQLKMTDVPATEVIIKSESGNLVINNPSVQRMKVQGKDMFQISGDITEEQTIEVTEDDIKLVMDQTGCSEAEVLDALAETDGDIAGAIIKLKKK